MSSPKQRPEKQRPAKQRPTKQSSMSVAEERALAQARAKEHRAAAFAALDSHFASAATGNWIVLVSWITTAVFVVPTVLGTITNDRTTRHTAAFIDLGLFAVGMVVFLAALWIGAQKSRTHELTMSGWWFLAGSAPRPVRLHLWGALSVQTIVSIVCAAIRFETALAFGVLVPTLGLAFLGLWGAIYGFFPQRTFD